MKKYLKLLRRVRKTKGKERFWALHDLWVFSSGEERSPKIARIIRDQIVGLYPELSYKQKHMALCVLGGINCRVPELEELVFAYLGRTCKKQHRLGERLGHYVDWWSRFRPQWREASKDIHPHDFTRTFEMAWEMLQQGGSPYVPAPLAAPESGKA